MRADVLILVEDAGAANMAAPLPAALGALGLGAALVADAGGAAQLAALGVDHRHVEGRDAAALLATFRPRLVVVGSSERADPLGPRMVAAARAAGLATAGLVDGPANADRRFRGVPPDRLLLADAATAAAYADLGLARAALAVVGHPHHDRVRAERAALDASGRAASRARVVPAAPADRPVLVILAERSSGLDPAAFRCAPSWTLGGRGASDARTDVVIEEILDALAPLAPRPWVVLRPHPAEPSDAYARFAPEVDGTGRAEPLFPLLHAADLVVGLTSAALDEAALLGRPTLAVVPRAAEAAWLASAAAGITPVAATRAALHARLRAPWPAPDQTALDRAFPPGAAARAARALAEALTVGV